MFSEFTLIFHHAWPLQRNSPNTNCNNELWSCSNATKPTFATQLSSVGLGKCNGFVTPPHEFPYASAPTPCQRSEEFAARKTGSAPSTSKQRSFRKSTQSPTHV